MLQTLRKRFERDEEGFTLIELMVVVLIIAILLAIAIPTFLGARERAQDRGAQSDVRNAYAAEKVIYTDDQQFTTDTAALKKIEPSITFLSSGTALAKNSEVNVAVANVTGTPSATAARVCLWTKSQTGKFFGVSEVTVGTPASVMYYENDTTAPTCPAIAGNATAQDVYDLKKW